MHDWRAILEQRFRGEPRDPATQSEILEELTQHFELRAGELRAQGISEDGIASRLEQEIAELDPESLIAARANQTPSYVEMPSSGGGWFDGLARDLVVGWRSLRRTPSLTAVIILSLALVLGANSTIFSLTDAMYLRRLALPSPEQLVRVDVVRDGHIASLPYAQFQTLRLSADLPTFAAYRFEGVEAVTPGGDTQRLWLDLVTSRYFDLIGIKPLVGRTLDAHDEVTHANVVVVSEDYWRLHLGSREDVLGQTLRLSDQPFTIVGVIPSRYRGLHFAHQFQMAAPFTVSPTGFSDLGILSTTIVARLDPARDPHTQRAAFEAAIRACCTDQARPSDEAIRSTTSTTLHVVAVDDPPYHEDTHNTTSARGLRVQLTDASRGLAWGRDFRARYTAALIGVAGGVLLLLLIACANVSTLLLVRGESRAREFAIRRSLGASVGRVRRHLFVEALELCLLGAAFGAALAWVATTLLTRALPASARPLGDVIAWRVDLRLILAALAMTTFCAVVTTLWPARRLGRDELLGALAGARTSVVGGLASHRALAAGQIALSMILITAAWLFVATIRNLTASAGGYGSRDVLLTRIAIPGELVNAPILDQVRDDILRISTVRAAAYAMSAPVLQDALMQPQVAPLGGTTTDTVSARMNPVSPEFFSATGIRIARGREFTTGDDAAAEPVAIVSESFQRHHYGDRSAIDAILLFPDRSKVIRRRVVGVARDIGYDRMQGLGIDLRDLEREMIYVPFVQSRPQLMATLIIDPAIDPPSVIAPVRRVFERHHLEAQRTTTVGALLDDAASRERFSAALATAFGVLAVLLAVTGVLGVLSFQVARRTKEIGVRMALGAQRHDAIALVLKQTLTMVASALTLGIPAAIGACWLVRSQLFGVPPWDPRGIVTAVAAIALAGIAASLVPSYRAARVDPLVALRED